MQSNEGQAAKEGGKKWKKKAKNVRREVETKRCSLKINKQVIACTERSWMGGRGRVGSVSERENEYYSTMDA